MQGYAVGFQTISQSRRGYAFRLQSAQSPPSSGAKSLPFWQYLRPRSEIEHRPPLFIRYIHASAFLCSQRLCASERGSRARDLLIAASGSLVVATVRCQIHFFFSKRVKLLTISDLHQTFHDKGVGRLLVCDNTCHSERCDFWCHGSLRSRR